MGRTVCDDARELLKSKKFAVKKVVRVYSPGDEGSNLDPDGKSIQTILWVTETGRAATATVEVDYCDKTSKIKGYTIHSVSGW